MRVIQVPMDESLLSALDGLAHQREQSRAEVIRVACRRYLTDEQRQRLEALYEEGYRRVPETPQIGEAQAAMAGEVLPAETW
jgi:metal-responsive CopG/Arc/MetJ family transcriptional regulator